MTQQLSIVLPAYNECQHIRMIHDQLIAVLNTLPTDTYTYELIYINDGSRDATWSEITKIAQTYEYVKWINFSRNFGKELALTAGLEHAKGDCVITIDCDGQHPVSQIPHFIDARAGGYDIVYNRRPEIAGASRVKKVTSKVFYRFFNKISEFKLEPWTTDYRLIDRKVIDVYLQFGEKNRIYRGLIDRVGFSKTCLVFDALPSPQGRIASYNYSKLVKLATDSITSFSLFPLKVVGYLGLLIMIWSGSIAVFILSTVFFLSNRYGFTNVGFLTIVNIFLGGIMMTSLGLIAIYIANIHDEVRHRPLYIIKDRI